MPQHRGRRPARDFTILHRRRKVAALYLRNYTQQEIARELDCTQALISLDLKEIRKQWIASGVMDFNERRSLELAKLDQLEMIAYEAWEKSRQDAEIFHVKTEAGGDIDPSTGRPAPTKTVSEKTTKGQAGDPRFLDQIHKCIAKRCDLLGLDAPKKVAPTTPDGTEQFTIGDDGERLAALLRAIGEVATAGNPVEPDSGPEDAD